MRVPIGTVCDVEALTAQCPPGSLPIVDETRTAGCEGSVEITDDSGAVTGICGAAESCTFICNFSDPCRCGIERITADGVFCAECVTACGDARCEGAENPESCPIDCAERCPPDAERCNGNDREVCEDNGVWTRLTCRTDQRCIFAPDPVAKGVSLCETSVSQGGGAFNGLGSWHPVEVDDYAPARFILADVGFEPVAFMDDGRVLGRDDDGQFLYADLTDPETPQIEELPTREQGALHLHSTTGILASVFATSRTRMVGRFQVWDLQSGGTRFLEDFGGFPTGQDVAQVQSGPWAISPDGSTVAFAISVPFDGENRTSIIIWNAADGQVVRLMRFAEADTGVPDGALPAGLVFSADGSNLVAMYGKAEGSLLVVWDVASGRFSRLFASTITPQRGATRFVGSRAGDSRVAVFDGRDGEVWDLMGQQRLLAFRQPGDTVVFTPDGASIVVGTEQLRVSDGAIERSWTGPAPLFDPLTPRAFVGRLLLGDVR